MAPTTSWPTPSRCTVRSSPGAPSTWIRRLQEGVAAALDGLDRTFYDGLATAYRGRRDLLYEALIEAGFACTPPEGAYYILTDFSGLSTPSGQSQALSDTEFAVWLSREIG